LRPFAAGDEETGVCAVIPVMELGFVFWNVIDGVAGVSAWGITAGMEAVIDGKLRGIMPRILAPPRS